MAVDEVPITAAGKDVIIIGGGDTGADCLGTSHRQGARSVTQLEIMPRPSDERPDANPWPTYPMVYKVTSARSEEHTSELQSLMRIPYAVFCFKQYTLYHDYHPLNT